MAEPPTIGETLRSSVQNVLNASYQEVAQKAADKAVAAMMRSSGTHGHGAAATNGQGMTIHQVLGDLTSICAELIKRNHALGNRLDEVENVVRALVQSAARRHG
jgi:hypothetical protein